MRTVTTQTAVKRAKFAPTAASSTMRRVCACGCLDAVGADSARVLAAVSETQLAALLQKLTVASVDKPRHGAFIRGFGQRFPVYPPTVRLFLRWLSSLMFGDHFPHELVELFVAVCALRPRSVGDRHVPLTVSAVYVFCVGVLFSTYLHMRRRWHQQQRLPSRCCECCVYYQAGTGSRRH